MMMRAASRGLLRRRASSCAEASTVGGWALSEAGRSAARSPETHAVVNQARTDGDWNAFAGEATLAEGLALAGGAKHAPLLEAYGAEVGAATWRAVAAAANRNAPTLETHDAFGRRVGRAAYDDGYHRLLALALERGAAGLAWQRDAGPGAHAARATALYLTYQLDPGVACPVTMTFASRPVLANWTSPAADLWLPKVEARAYDGRDVPVEDKRAATVGMSMTEKQGGSDVRANSTVAERVNDEEYVLTGHKWFTSAPNSDAFLTLAQTGEGPTCFLVPRRLPGGEPNAGFRPLRLKAKLGDHSNASSEVEYANAWALLVGEPGRGLCANQPLVGDVPTKL